MVWYKVLGTTAAATGVAILATEASMPDLIELKQAPYLVAVVVIVFGFLRYLQVSQKQNMQTMKEMGVACHKSQRANRRQLRQLLEESHRVIAENSKSNDELRNATWQQAATNKQVEEILKDVKTTMRGK